MSRRSQIFSFDFISSIVIFLVFLTLFFFVYSQLKADAAGAETARDAQNTAALLSDELVGTAGVPANWTNLTVVTIGLASEGGVVSESKARALGNVTYQNSKTKAVLNQFEFFINISSVGVRQIFTYGSYPPSNATSIVPIKRMVLYDNGTRELAFTQVIVWK